MRPRHGGEKAPAWGGRTTLSLGESRIMFAEVVSVVANLMDRLAAAVKGDYEGADEAIGEGRRLIEAQLELFDCSSE